MITTTDIHECPKSLKELKANIKEFDKKFKPTPENVISPRLFRIYIGVSKQTLSNWKYNANKAKWFDLIKNYEDILLAFIEQRTIDLSESEGRTNLMGLFNVMRAYDTKLYVPESRPIKTNTEALEPIVINFENKSKLKLDMKIQPEKKGGK